MAARFLSSSFKEGHPDEASCRLALIAAKPNISAGWGGAERSEVNAFAVLGFSKSGISPTYKSRTQAHAA